ncbi:hypothetical protein Tco_1045122 [Tanacetum coccineum]|uniref:Uncharacterized protein n=1 Tax=Tanacetum coccineum TaxID=301880 RepID=A0ABQ5GU21_9ASTR
MKHEQLFAEFNVSTARNLSLSSEVRMRTKYNILEKRKWKSLAEEKNNLLQVKDKEIEELRFQLLQAKDESMEVARLRTRVSSLEAIEGSLRGEVASAKEHNGLLEQEHNALKLKVTTLESIIAEKDRELSDMGTSASSLRSQNQSLVNQENFHPHVLNVIAGRRWLLTYGMKLLMAKCLNSIEYMEARGNAFGRTIEKGMQEGLAAGIEHGQAGRCLSDLKAYNPSAEADFNSPPVTALITTALSTVVIHPNSDPFLLVTDYENPDLAGAVPEDVIPGPEGEGKVEGSTKGDVDDVFSQLENEARDAVL